MFSKFFIERPRFAVVIAIVMALAGIVSVMTMPIGMYPEIAPPEILVSTTYIGASAETVANNVGIPLEKAINGIENMLYMSSNSYNSGAYDLSVVFETGTDPDLDQVKVQNRIQQVVATLPKEVQDVGVTVQRRSSDILAFLQVTSPKGTYNSNEYSHQKNSSSNGNKLNSLCFTLVPFDFFTTCLTFCLAFTHCVFAHFFVSPVYFIKVLIHDSHKYNTSSTFRI